MIDFLNRVFKKKQWLYLPIEDDSIVILKHFYYEDIVHNVYDEYPKFYQELDKTTHISYKGRTVLEYFPGQEYKIKSVFGIGKIDMRTLQTLKHIGRYLLNIEPTSLQPGRVNVGHQLEYLLLFKGGYIREKRDYLDSKLKNLLP